MNIIIVGAGVVGETLAEQLSSEQHHVTIIEQDRARVNELAERLDVLALHGNASSPTTLDRAGMRDADMVIAVTNVDEVNIVVGMMAHKLGIPHRIVRCRNPEFNRRDGILSLSDLGIDHVINPEPSIVDSLVRMMNIPGTGDVTTIADGQILILRFDIAENSPAAGKTLAQLRDLGDLISFLILYIVRGDEAFVPRGDDRLQPGDHVQVLAAADTVEFLLPIMHRTPHPVRQVIIAGASRIGIELAQRLEEEVPRVVLMDADRGAAREAADELRKTIVLHGDPASVAMLEEAAIDHCDLFCALSEGDEANMLASLLARRHGAKRTAVLVQRPDYVAILNSLGIDTVINPRLVTVGEILTHVRRGHVYSVTRLPGSHAELLELEAIADSPVVGVPLRNMKLPRNTLIGAVLRDGVMQVPNGETVIAPGETVVVYALPEAIAAVERLFSAKD